ncbi:MAG: restriction endonuclease [Fimbriimonadaceae bacterium]
MNEPSVSVPSYDAMLEPSVKALDALGGSGSIQEINAKVAEILELSDDVREVQHGSTSVSEVDYRLAWSRTYLKKFGLLDNSSRGVWSLTAKGKSTSQVDAREIVAFVRGQFPGRTAAIADAEALLEDAANAEQVPPWEQTYLSILLRLSPAAFERLVKRMLRESGFTQVEVVGRTGDDGIDGIGIARISGFLSFRVLFQCKRYQGSVTPSEIRDFRGAMQGRTDKGLFATTGTFSQKAVSEATREGAPPIDLLDGPQLVQRLKELGLGVKIHMVESVEVDTNWFESI